MCEAHHIYNNTNRCHNQDPLNYVLSQKQGGSLHASSKSQGIDSNQTQGYFPPQQSLPPRNKAEPL